MANMVLVDSNPRVPNTKCECTFSDHVKSNISTVAPVFVFAPTKWWHL